jgi:hypothetical protein
MGYEHFEDIKEIPAEVKLIKCKLDSLSFDISINNFVGLVKLSFMNYLESKYENKIIFKRTLFLIKSWSYYQASILGSNLGLMSSYALEVIVIYLFNQFPHLIKNECDALFLFFKTMCEIDWDKEVLSVLGIISKEDFIQTKNKLQNQKLNKLNSSNLIKIETEKWESLINDEELYIFMKKYENLLYGEKSVQIKKNIEIKLINIVDPLLLSNNLGRSVNFHNFSKIQKVFQFANLDSNKIILLKQKQTDLLVYLNRLFQLFDKIIIFNNPSLYQSILNKPQLLYVEVEIEEEKETNTSKYLSVEPFFQELSQQTVELFNSKFIKKEK